MLTALALVVAGAATARGPRPRPGARRPRSSRSGSAGAPGRADRVQVSVVAEYDTQAPERRRSTSSAGSTTTRSSPRSARGNAPDVVSSFNSYNVGNYCGSGGVDRPRPAISKKDHIERRRCSRRRPATTRSTRGSAARCRCSPTTTASTTTRSCSRRPGSRARRRRSPSSTADAKKLTVRDKNGTIKVAGFDPVIGFYENTPDRWIQQFGGKWVDAKGTRLLGKDPAWAKWAHLAEEPRRLVRLRQARPVPGRPADEFSAVAGIRDGQARDELRR